MLSLKFYELAIVNKNFLTNINLFGGDNKGESEHAEKNIRTGHVSKNSKTGRPVFGHPLY